MAYQLSPDQRAMRDSALAYEIERARTRIYPPATYFTERAGTQRWVLAERLTARLRAKGYEVAIPRKKWDQWTDEWRNAP